MSPVSSMLPDPLIGIDAVSGHPDAQTTRWAIEHALTPVLRAGRLIPADPVANARLA